MEPQRRQFMIVVLMLVFLALGNLCAFHVSEWLLGIDYGLAHLIPFVFLAIPLVLWLLAARNKLLHQGAKYRIVAVILMVISVAVWIVVLYVT